MPNLNPEPLPAGTDHFSCRSVPDQPGIYRLRLRLDAPTRIQVGRHDAFDFPAGIYLYMGSALGGLRARIARHWLAEKPLRWHIDYLRAFAHLEAVTTYVTEERLECALAQQILALDGARIIVPRFGASDCHCPAHLVYLDL
jgi:Uri superfamily endonuclease